ncbi:hypothetical protein ACXC9Q_18795 [Kribbella sp. CWNU-51]
MHVIVLYCLAGLFELVGLALAFHGFDRTWKEFVHDETLGSAFRRSSLLAVRRSAAAADRWGRQVLHIKGRAKVVQGVAMSSMRMTSRATGRVSFGPLPSIVDDPQGFAEEVHRRLQRAHATGQDAQEAIADEREARVESVSALDRRTQARITEVAGKSENIAVGGLVEQIWGWLFILAGVALGAIGDIVQAAQS